MMGYLPVVRIWARANRTRVLQRRGLAVNEATRTVLDAVVEKPRLAQHGRRRFGLDNMIVLNGQIDVVAHTTAKTWQVASSTTVNETRAEDAESIPSKGLAISTLGESGSKAVNQGEKIRQPGRLHGNHCLRPAGGDATELENRALPCHDLPLKASAGFPFFMTSNWTSSPLLVGMARSHECLPTHQIGWKYCRRAMNNSPSGKLVFFSLGGHAHLDLAVARRSAAPGRPRSGLKPLHVAGGNLQTY